MSVYTLLQEEDFKAFLALYDEGELVCWKGIEAGVENTNYFVSTRHPEKGEQHFVLTIFEYVPAEQLPFFIQFMALLAHSGLPVPTPIHGLDNKPLRQLKNKPCMLQTRLAGHHAETDTLSLDQCHMIGESLARIHHIGQQADFTQSNFRGMGWIEQQINRLASLLPEDEAQLQKQQWQAISATLAGMPNLPRGLIHADLFVDNVLFHNGQISGIIDFFQSCEEWLLYDVAVTVNDWCLHHDSLELNPARTSALLNAYNAIRPFTDDERKAWPVMQRLACLRFWISRIVTYTHPEHEPDNGSDENSENVVRHFKDPAKFKKMLTLRTLTDAVLVLP